MDSLFLRNELFIATAAVAAHAVGNESGFRQRDLKFLVELFINFADLKTQAEALQINNNQIKRYIDSLVQGGYARVASRKAPLTYRLTRVGLLELMSRIVQRRCYTEREHFFFLYFFIRNYKPHIQALVRAEGKLFPYSLKIELEALLDVTALLDTELRRAEKELRRAEDRIKSADECAKYIKSELRRGKDYADIILEVEHLFPYELNSQKPLSELIRQIPPFFQRWEMEEGGPARANQIWGPARSVLSRYIEELKRIIEREQSYGR